MCRIRICRILDFTCINIVHDYYDGWHVVPYRSFKVSDCHFLFRKFLNSCSQFWFPSTSLARLTITGDVPLLGLPQVCLGLPWCCLWPLWLPLGRRFPLNCIDKPLSNRCMAAIFLFLHSLRTYSTASFNSRNPVVMTIQIKTTSVRSVILCEDS